MIFILFFGLVAGGSGADDAGAETLLAFELLAELAAIGPDFTGLLWRFVFAFRFEIGVVVCMVLL